MNVLIKMKLGSLLHNMECSQLKNAFGKWYENQKQSSITSEYKTIATKILFNLLTQPKEFKSLVYSLRKWASLKPQGTQSPIESITKCIEADDKIAQQNAVN